MPSSAQNINSHFFEGLYKHAWKKIIPPGLTEAEVDFIEEIGALKKGDKVLDIMCGFGRHVFELAKRGIAVTAVDNLEDYIDEIRETSLKNGLPVEAIQSDVLDMDLQDQYDAVICMGNSHAFFNREETVSILKNISAHLKQGGVLIINSWMIAEIAIKYFREKDWHFAGDYKCLLDYKFFFHPSRIESEQTIIAPDGSIEVTKGVDFIFTLDELETIFQEAKLKTTELYSTPRKKKFVLGDNRVYIVVKKN